MLDHHNMDMASMTLMPTTMPDISATTTATATTTAIEPFAEPKKCDVGNYRENATNGDITEQQTAAECITNESRNLSKSKATDVRRSSPAITPTTTKKSSVSSISPTTPSKAKTLFGWLRGATTTTTTTTTATATSTSKSLDDADNTSNIYVNVALLANGENLKRCESKECGALSRSGIKCTCKTNDLSPSKCNNTNNNNNNNNNNNTNKLVATTTTPSSKILAKTTTNNVNNKERARSVGRADDIRVVGNTGGGGERSRSPDASLREFRGVQSLRHLWNKRISAYEESRFGRSFGNFGHSRVSKLTKSISCLVNAAAGGSGSGSGSASQEGTIKNSNSSTTCSGTLKKKSTAKRAHSLHDCTQLDHEEVAKAREENTTVFSELEESDKRHIDLQLHREKDNFYKYKTAEQAAKHLARDTAARTSRRSTTVIEDSLHFPAVSKGGTRGAGERIHWLRRQELSGMTQNISSTNFSSESGTPSSSVVESVASSVPTSTSTSTTTTTTKMGVPTTLINSENTDRMTTGINERNKRLNGWRTTQEKDDDNMDISAFNVCQTSTTLPNTVIATPEKRRDLIVLDCSANSTKQRLGSLVCAAESETTPTRSSRGSIDSISGHSNSRNSLGGTSNGSGGSGTTPRRSTSSAARKCSFKTHTRSYHGSRKMNGSAKDGSGGHAGGGGSGSSGLSMVARLTQQFNEIIQKDKSVLEEVKRKKGVLMSRGGHIYKVVETSNPGSLTRANGARLARELNGTTTAGARNSMVQRNIKKFENGGQSDPSKTTPNCDCEVTIKADDLINKPSVPVKSANVLRKRHELVANTQQHSSAASNIGSDDVSTAKSRMHLNLTPPGTGSGVTGLLMPLEAVTEEAKTPIENEERNAIADMPIASSKVITYALINRTQPKIVATNSGATTPVYATPTQKRRNKKSVTGEENKIVTEQTPMIMVTSKEEHDENITSSISTSPGNSLQIPSQSVDGIDGNNISANAGHSDVELPSPGSYEKAKQHKNKYAKIYEKFRFRSPFKKSAGSSRGSSPEASKSPVSPVVSPAINATAVWHADSYSASSSGACTPMTIEPEAKIWDALEVIDQKLKGLNGNNITTTSSSEECDETTPALMLRPNDDFEQRILPNSSFVYQAACSQQSNASSLAAAANQLLVTQAVNVALVNNIEGEYLLKEMRDKECTTLSPSAAISLESLETLNQFRIRADSKDLLTPIYSPSKSNHHQLSETNNDLEQIPLANLKDKEEGFYEPIAIGSMTEIEKQPQDSFLYKTAPKISSQHDEIYQSLEDAMRISATANNGFIANDYESIAGSGEHAAPSQLVHFDGYEVFASPSPSTNNDTTTMITTPTPTTAKTIVPGASVGGRNTTDELPELPQPKRRLPKSPAMTDKRSPPQPNSHSSTEITATTMTMANDDRKRENEIRPPIMLNCGGISEFLVMEETEEDDEHHYYADDENIYDTIKGSHCYESVHTDSVRVLKITGNNIEKTATLSKSGSDSVSITSNCYESISHYRRLIIGSNGQRTAAGSSSGSTLTISSDHKTNSLYEGSLVAGIMYGGMIGGHHVGSGSGSSGGGGGVGRRRASMSGSGASSTGTIGDGCCDTNGTTNGNHLGGEKAQSCCTPEAGESGGSSAHYVSHSHASENSDEWVDISDGEIDGCGADDLANPQVTKQQFIVVRERSKTHRSPDWSKRVRDKRLQQKKAISYIEDDSDHYYESLSPLGNKRHSTQLVHRSNSHHKRNQDLPRYALAGAGVGNGGARASQRDKKYSASAHALGQAVSDDYDSFDTDTDLEEQMKNHNDSGVDIRNVKLPDPPPSTNQVYAMVRKIKKFISNKKSPGSRSKQLTGSQQKLYENSTQFYVEGNVYENTPKNKSSSSLSSGGKNTTTATTTQVKTAAACKALRPAPLPPTGDADAYENTDFHSPPTIESVMAKQLSTSDKNLNHHGSATLRATSKATKSFKLRLRKSLGTSTYDSKSQLSTLTPTRSTFYIDEPSHCGSGELDSGFSEKASSGDLVPLPSSRPGNDVSGDGIPSVEDQKFLTMARKAKKTTNAQRRRTTSSIRPHEPPPPPPPHGSMPDESARRPQTSWYAECGVFKNGAATNVGHDEHSLSGGSKSNYSQNGSASTAGTTNGGGTSWYAEAGLYQTSGVSVASSSGSSGVSTGNEAGLGDDLPHSMFLNEPLYQIYSAAKLESISRDIDDHEGSTDGYEEVGQHRGGGHGSDANDNHHSHPRMSRPTALHLVGQKTGPSRTLWSEIPEVINSCILPTLTPRERGLQEAKFEIITSEASYLKSLNLLRSHYMNNAALRDSNVLSGRDRKALFSYIVPVHECSERLLTELETCWQDSIMLLGLSKRIYAIAEKQFHVYIAFCEHQGRMDRTLRRLKEAKGVVAQTLDQLQANPICCGLNLHSFLMLPMQRITRLPLLIDAVFSKCSANDDEYDQWKMTLAIMNKVVTQCNEAANRCEQAYEIERISRQLEFPSSIRALAIAPAGVPAVGSKPRFLVKKGELVHLIWRGDDGKLTFGKKFIKTTIFAFLFSDLLVLTKRKNDGQFVVFDYCPRNMLTISSGDTLPQLPTKDLNQTGRNFILMTLLENHERKTVELVLSCQSVSEQERWLQTMRPPQPEAEGEKLYEQWDCPQVIAKHAYEAQEPDALDLEVGDAINVTRKLPDGWYQGERLRDGATGWFPGSYTDEVNSAHVRARNLKQRYRLLTFTATYLEAQKRK